MSLVKQFGAIGDGVADDTAALQHAVDSGDGEIELSRGTYRIHQPIVIDLKQRGYTGIRGAQGTARVVMAGPGPAFHVIGDHRKTADPDGFEPHTWDKERLPIISGLEILGDHQAAEGIRAQKTMQCTITNVLIRKCRYGIRLIERNRNFLLANSHLYQNGEIGVFFDRVNMHQTNIIGNHISYSTRAGIMIKDGEIRNLQITGNDIEYNDDDPEGSAEIWIDTREGTMRELTIASNTIQAQPKANGANIRIVGQPAPTSDRSGLLTIAGNLIGSQTNNIELRHTRGVAITGNSIYSAAEWTLDARDCRTIVFTGNSIDHNPGIEDKMKDGIRFENCQGCGVNGTVMEDCRAGSAESGGAVSLLNCRDMAVSDCQILDPANRGIYLKDTHRSRITNNSILDRRDPKRMAIAVEVAGNSKQNLISNNMIQPGTRGGIVPESAADPNANTIL